MASSTAMFITPAIVPELAVEYGVSTGNVGIAGSAFMLLGSVVGLYFGYAEMCEGLIGRIRVVKICYD